MTIFLIIFFDKILAKYSLKRTKLHHFFKFSRGSMPPNPLANAWLRHALHAASRHANYPIFPETFLTSPRNEILDTPLTIVSII